MSAGFNFNQITLSDQADITKVMENFEKIEQDGITYDDAKQKATTTQDGIMSKEDKSKLDSVESGATSNIGTITEVVAGTGLSGGATSGSATLNVVYGTTANSACQGNDSRLSNARTPTSHASTGTTFGVGSTTNYGHCKTINDLTHSAFTNGEGLSAYQGYLLKGMIDNLTPVLRTYTGNGSKTNSQFANLGYIPKLLICMGFGSKTSSSANDRQFAHLGIFVSDGTNYQLTMTGSDMIYICNNDVHDPSISMTVTSTGFTITTPSSYTPTWLNNSGYKYTYFAIK